MKILLADDDKLIRFSLKSMLTEILDSDFIITEASNGLEMIQRCNEYDPDIAFVDIRMPHLNGIEAIEACQKISPDTEFVIISGYSDFEYAKKCISLGVQEYVLKPISSEQLEEIIKKTKEKLSHQMTQKNNLFQLYIHDYFHTPAHEVSPTLPDGIISGVDSRFAAFVIFIDCTNDPKVYHDLCNRITQKIKSIGAQLIQRNMYYSILYSPEGCLQLIVNMPVFQINTLKNKMEQLLTTMSSEQCRLYLFYEESAMIEPIYHACEKIEGYPYIRIGAKPCDAIQISKIDYKTLELDFYKNLFCLITAFLEANEVQYTQSLNLIYRTYYERNITFPLKTIAAYVKCVLGIDVDTDNFKSFMKSFIQYSDRMYKNVEYKVTDKIDLIIDYINHSYMNDISINQIASKFDLTPNYVSKLFHDKTSTKFIDYLTNIRIVKAKKLLISNSDTPVKDIALMVGYYSSRHFSSIFKKYTGIYPTEYRKQYLAEKG